MTPSRLLGLALPLFVAPITIACSSDSGGTTATTTGGNTGGSGGVANTGGSSAGGSSAGGASAGGSSAGGSSAGGAGTGGDASGGAGGEGGSPPECGDGTPAAGQICFDNPVGYDAEGEVTALAVGAWDGAGADIVYGEGAAVHYMPGDGTGTIGSPMMITQNGISIQVNDLALGQLDDGTNLDLVAASNVSTTTFAFGDGSGGVTATEGLSGSSEGATFDVHVADIFGSGGSDDVIKLNALCGSVIMTSGDEGEGFNADSEELCEGSAGALARTSASATSAVWVDSDGGPSATLKSSVITVDGSTFTLETPTDATLEGNGGRVAVGDLTGDDYDDFVVLVPDNKINVLIGDAADGWVDQSGDDYLSFAVGTGPLDVAIADLDGDGDLDVATTNSEADTITVLLNDGSGGFTTHTIDLVTDAAPTRIALGDLNDDGVADIVVATTLPEEITVLLSDP